MNRIVIAAAAFVAGLGGTTAIFAVRAKPAPPAAEAAAGDSAKADSTARHAAPDSAAAAPTSPDSAAVTAPTGTPADSTHPATPTTPAGAAATPAGAHAAPAGVPAVPAATPAGARAAGGGVPAVPTAAPAGTANAAATPRPVSAGSARAAQDSVLRDATYRQLARIYSAMKPSEAAEVLSHIGDEDVVGILTKFGTRQAAQILGAMPRERAAGLSQRLLNASSPQRASQ